MTDREKDEAAARILAVIRGRQETLSHADTEDILDRARRRAHATDGAPGAGFAWDPARRPAGSSPHMRLADRCLFALGGVLLAVYFFRLTRPSLHVYFSPDDLMNLYRSWIFPAGALLKANLLFFLNSGFIRPMGSVWYRLIYDVAGFHPFWFHAANLAILLANAWLTYAVARPLAGSREAASLTALGMSYQPRLASLYFDTGFVYDVLCYFFLFAALVLYLGARERNERLRPWRWATLFVLYICALNSKEMAVILPPLLAAYELVYHAPQSWRLASLRDWLLRESRAAVLAGAVAVLFLIGRSMGTSALTTGAAYRPSFTWSQFTRTSGHFLGDFLHTPDWPAWEVLLLWAVMASVVWGARSRALAFAWLFLMISPLPVAFILPRSAAQYYVCVFGWVLYAAVLLARLASVLARDAGPAHWWMARARGAVLFVVLMAILYSAYKPLGYGSFAGTLPGVEENRRTVAQLHAAAPAIPHGSRLLFLDDPVAPSFYDLLFMVRLSYHDPSLEVFRAKTMTKTPAPAEFSSYDYVFDYRDHRFFALLQPRR